MIIVIDNAGIMMVPYDETIEFLETQIGIVIPLRIFNYKY
jgi:hypothetical protein